MDARVLKGEAIKNTAEDENYIPIIGSSELSRMDPFHPSSMAQKYHWKNQPFLLGNPGTASLTQAMNVSGMSNLRNQKAVFIISPQWFTKKGARSDAFKFYFSPMQLTSFILKANPHHRYLDEYIAQRIIQLGISKGPIKNDAIRRIAAGEKITGFERFYLERSLSSLQSQDYLFGSAFLNDHEKRINKAADQLPNKYDYKHLDKLAVKLAKRHSHENDLQIVDSFYRRELNHRIAQYANSHTKADYLHSPEYNDFEALLYMFKQNHVQVLFVIQPVNKKWMEYTGMPQSSLDNFDRKIKYQLNKQGFNDVVDLTTVKNSNYIAEDTIHMGWRGWLMLDKKLIPYYRDKHADPKATQYHMDNYFLTNSWANKAKKFK